MLMLPGAPRVRPAPSESRRIRQSQWTKGVLLLDDLALVDIIEAAAVGKEVGEPAVGLGGGGAAGGAGEQLRDVGLATFVVVAGDDGLERRRSPARFSEADAVGELGEAGVDHGESAIADGIGGHGAGDGVARDADHAVLAQEDLDGAEGARALGDDGGLGAALGVQDGENAGDAAVHGGRFAEIEAGGGAVLVVAKVDDDLAGGGVDVDGGLQMEAVWEAREGVHGGFGLDAAGREGA